MQPRITGQALRKGNEMDKEEKYELIELAEILDAARIRANAIESAAPQGGVYGHVSDALSETLTLIVGAHDSGRVYAFLLDGLPVREALVRLWYMDGRGVAA